MKRTFLFFVFLSFVFVSIAQNTETKTEEVILGVTHMDSGGDETIHIDESKAKKNNDVYAVVEEMPEFPGGPDKMKKFIQKKIKYPSKERKEKIGGKIFLKFVVDVSGQIRDVEILKSTKNANLDKEAVRVVNLMPKWKPGKQNGKAVSVFYNLPINFDPN